LEKKQSARKEGSESTERRKASQDRERERERECKRGEVQWRERVGQSEKKIKRAMERAMNTERE
jgi:hypothetical protein